MFFSHPSFFTAACKVTARDLNQLYAPEAFFFSFIQLVSAPQTCSCVGIISVQEHSWEQGHWIQCCAGAQLTWINLTY